MWKRQKLWLYIYIYIDMHTFMKNKNMYTLSSKKKKMYTHVQRELSARGARRGGAGRKVMAEYSCGRNVMAERQKRRQSGSVLFSRGRKVMAVG